MGVKGLTGYVAQRNTVAGKRKTFGSSTTSSDQPDDGIAFEEIIIDGSAFAYRISRLHLDWTRGGESATLQRVLAAYISAFKNVHLLPIFVWDGTFDLQKLETVKNRAQSSIRNSISFMRAGPSLRANRGFQVECSILPILTIRACIAHLRNLAVEQLFPPGEADPVIAELAIQRKAYIASLDSDFFITSHGTKGYIPLDSMNFTYTPTATEAAAVDDADADWAPVKTKASSKSRAASTTSLETLAMSTELLCMVNEPAALAAQIGIQVTWLPLLAVVAGNDYYTPSIWRTTGAAIRGVSSSQRRLELVGKAMVKCANKQRSELTTATLPAFLARVLDEVREFAMTDGQISDVVSRCLDALPQYSVSSLGSSFLPPSSSSLMDSSLYVLLSTSEDPDYLLKTRLLNAYEHGHFRNSLLQILATGIYIPMPVLEDPDLASCNISCARSIRLWIYALLHESVGIRQTVPPELEEDEAESMSSNAGACEEAIGAREDDEEPDEACVESPAVQPDDSKTALPAIVTEYVRRNAALVGEEISITALSELVGAPPSSPALGAPTLDRYRLFLQATSSYTPGLAEATGSHLTVLAMIASLRHLTLTFEGSRTQAWSATERRAALAMAYLIAHHKAPALEATSTPSYQRAAQLTSTLNAVSMLVECLLLTPLIPQGELLYEGRLFHKILEITQKEIEEILVQEELDLDSFGQLVELMEEELPQKAEPQAQLSKSEKKRRRKLTQVDSVSRAESPSNPFHVLL